jgi:predicted RNA-binding Zn-ribbon protein involved in translation (DUF1610 family)
MTQQDHRFPCESCGSDLRFDPGKDRLVCDHCGNTQAIDHGPWTRTRAIAELDFERTLRALPEDPDFEVTRVSQCPNCGARVEFDPDVHATECPFCATPVVTDTGSSRQIKPRAILPFTLEENQARAAMTEWLGSLWFAPSGLMQYARKGRKMNGIYTPCWTFDADTKSSYRGYHGTVYYERHTIPSGKQSQTVMVPKVRWKPASGRVARYFDDVLVVASEALPEKFRTGVSNWDLSLLEPYAPEYLAGFRSESYTVGLKQALGHARIIMDRQILRDVRFDIGGDRQRVEHVETAVSNVTFKHILVPIWIAAYRYRGRSYRFVVNGQTGAVTGERPWSGVKIALAVGAAMILAAILGYFYAMNN